jgi:hypothetical protein
VTATIDVLVDVEADGGITKIEIVRWAGFGLDESVAETVRKMNWRPAERNGKRCRCAFYCATILSESKKKSFSEIFNAIK